MKRQRITVHVSDDTGRIAMYEKRTIGSAADDHDTASVLTRYIYSNHLGSAALELDEEAAIISYEEYHPYGTTSYQETNAGVQAVAKRYRYTGKERDDETGLYYHGARYYIPWLARWSAVDPLEGGQNQSPYVYVSCNPVNDTDSTGLIEDRKLPKPENFQIQKPPGFEEPVPPNPPPIELLDNPLPSPEDVDPQIIPTEEEIEEEPLSTEKPKEESLAEKVADTALDFVPIIGGIKDIIKGIKGGDGVTAAIGIVSIIVDVATMGGGSLVKGSIKTLVKFGVKGSAEVAAKEAIENSVKTVISEGVEQAAKTSTTALRKVGSVLESVDDVLTNPSILQGQSYGYVRNMLGKSEGWVNSVMTKTRGTDKGWVLRQVNGRGQETGRLIQYHPGSRRHFGGAPYWKVSDGANTFRFPAAN